MQPKPRTYTVEEYFALDEAAPQGVRLEYEDGTLYLNGQPYDPDWGWDVALDMAGASPEHVRIASRLVTQLNNRLRNGCEALVSDMRVRVPDGKYTYPDVVVFCGEMDLTDERPPALLNPLALIEVISSTSQGRDMGAKLDLYLQIPSLKEYWIVEQGSPRIIRYVRTSGTWVVHLIREGAVKSEHLGIEIPLSEIYPA